jgi:hypothetical protein
MFEAYRDKVFNTYKKKKNEDQLSLKLLRSTPANLRDECLLVLNTRYLKADESTLTNFFGQKADAEGYSKIIRNFETSKFKPLDNYLKGFTSFTDDKNVELLAWLIDFEPRPYKYRDIYSKVDTNVTGRSTDSEGDISRTAILGEELKGRMATDVAEREEQKPGDVNLASENNNIPEQEPDVLTSNLSTNNHLAQHQDSSKEEANHLTPNPLITQNSNQPGDLPKEEAKNIIPNSVIGQYTDQKDNLPLQSSKWKNANIRRSIFAFLAAGTVCFITYLLSGNNNSNTNLNNQRCMYWTGDHYQAISCNDKIEDFPIIALDTFKVNHLKRITRPDTLTGYSLTKVWYAKIDGKVEFYTHSGEHPVDHKKRLLPMSRLILSKYAK